jgi:hypothetical protein
LISHDLLIVSFLGGGTGVGVIINYILSRQRETETRKLSKQKELTYFLADWKGKITTDHASNLPIVYARELPQLQTKAAAVRDHLGEMQRAKFNELIGNLSRLTPDQITHPRGKTPQEVICEPLDALQGFIED